MELVHRNELLQAKYEKIKSELQLFEEVDTADADLIVAAYGITARIAKGAVRTARSQGMKVGLIRPITLWPFPEEPFKRAAETAERFLVVEMSNGQFIEDVKLASECRRPVEFLGKGGGWYPTPEAILEKISAIYEKSLAGERPE
jgi:2-oxoglutarate ferredoxin oxidoreductase subunit alpha